MTATAKFLWFCVVVVYLFIAFASPAKAHIVVRDPLQPKPVKAKIKLVKKNYYHAVGVMRSVRQQENISPSEWRMYENHRWLYRRASARLTELRERLLASRRPPHYNDWLCIKEHEGAWDDPNAPYYGGLQMDMDFMRAYGPTLLLTKGTADNWTPLEQMWVAEKAYSSGRGFYPWPNTARECGLI